MGLNGTEAVAKYVVSINEENVDYNESLAAKEYFSFYHEGLNRRTEDPINSRLNYGYAVVRSAIARKLVAAGFHPTFGIHHDNQLNAFNLAYVLHIACMVDGAKVNVLSAIDMMVESLKRIILESSNEKLKLPIIIPIEDMAGITE